jgi:hypothetical protein
MGARSSLAPLGEPEPITPPIQGDAGVPPAMPASACAVRKRKADVSSTAVTQTAKRAVSAALDARGGPKQESAVSSARLLLAVWAAAVASLTRGRCSPSEGAQAAAVVLFARFKRTQRSRSEESSGEDGGYVHPSEPCSAAPCASPDLDSSVGAASDFVVVSEDAAYLAASLWCAFDSSCSVDRAVYEQISDHIFLGPRFPTPTQAGHQTGGPSAGCAWRTGDEHRDRARAFRTAGDCTQRSHGKQLSDKRATDAISMPAGAAAAQ